MSKKKDILILILKCVVSFSLLGFILFFKIPLKDIKNVIISADIGWILVSFSLHSLGLLISAVRWKILIKAQDDDASLVFLLKSYLVGSFFNNLLPTRIGGDAVRVWDGSRLSRSVLKSFAIVLVERLTGIAVLLFFALGGAAIRLEMARNIPLGRVGQPEDIAAAAIYLASEASEWVTGITIDVAGGPMKGAI